MATRNIGGLNINFTPTQNQTQLYNMIGRDAGLNYNTQQQANFWDNPIGNAWEGFKGNIENRARAAENAFGTFGASIVGAIDNANENRHIDERNNRWNMNMNDIYKQAGFNSADDYYNAKDAAEKEIFGKYGFDSDDYWNRRADADLAGDKNTVAQLDAARENIKKMMNADDLNTINRFDTTQQGLINQSNANYNEAKQAADNWRDYRNNSYWGKKINQDRGKFLGDSMLTVSTAADLAAMGAGLPMGIAANAIQGGVEGVANELSQNGLENFDWGRAGQNALIGAASGAATAGLNKVLPGAKAGGLVKNIASSTGRGALSGAVGGAVGGGLGAAMNGQDVLQGTLSGAGQGAVSGGVSGAAMGTVNALGNKVIGKGLERAQARQQAGQDATFGDKTFNKIREIQTTGQRWTDSGENFNERLTNTLNSGDSAVGNWINGKQSKTLGTLGNVGNKVQDVSRNTQYRKARELAKQMLDAFEKADPEQHYEGMYSMAEQEGLDWDTARGKKAFTEKWLDQTAKDIIKGGDNREMWAKSLNDYIDYPEANGNSDIDQLTALRDSVRGFDGDTARMHTGLWGGNDVDYQNAAREVYSKIVDKYGAEDANAVFSELGFMAKQGAQYDTGKAMELMKSVYNKAGNIENGQEIRNWMKQAGYNPETSRLTPTTAKGWLKRAARRAGEDLSNKGVGLSLKDVNDEDALIRADWDSQIKNRGDQKDQPFQVFSKIKDFNKLDDLAMRYGYTDFDEAPYEMQVRMVYETGQGDHGVDYEGFLDNNPVKIGSHPEYAAESSYGKDPYQRVYSVSGTDEQYTFASNDNAPRNVKQAAVDYAYETDGRVDPAELTDFYNQTRNVPNTDVEGMAMAIQAETDGRVDANELLDFVRAQDGATYGSTKAINFKGEEAPTTASGWLKKAAKRAVEDINKTNLGNRIQDVSDDEPQSLKQRALDAVNSLKGRQPAYAGGVANATVIEGGAPDGGNLVKADYPLPSNASNKTIAQAIRNVIKSKFQGNSYNVGETGVKAAVNAKTVSEMGYQQPNMTDTDFNRKGSMAGNLDELLENMTDARRVANKKPETKPNVDYYISGRVAVDLGDGEVYSPRVDVEVSGGKPVAYNISDIKKYPGSTPQGVPSGGDQPAVDYQGTYGRKTIIPQNEQNGNYSDDINNMFVNRNDMLDTAAESPETELYRQLTGNGGNNGSTAQTPLTAANTGDSWDNLAREYGYNTYNDAIRAFAAANPNTPISAGAVTTWLDSNEGNYNPNRVQITQNATMPTEIQEAEIVPSKTSRETKLKYAQGKELLAQYGAVDQPMARATKAPETFQKLAEMGFTKPGDVEKISNAITGSNGAVSKLTKSVIASAKPVNTFDGETAGQTMDDFINNSIEHNMLSGTNQGKAVKRGIDAYLRSLPSHADGSITMEDSAADAFKVVQGLEARAAELEGRGGSTYHRATTEDVHQAAVLKDVANLLKDRIYAGANVKAALTPEVAQELKAFDPKNTTWAKTVDDFVSSAKTAQDLRSFQKPFVRANRYIDNQYVQAATAGGRMAASAGELPAILPTTKAGIIKQVVNNVWNSNPAHRARAAAYGKLAENAAANAPQTPTTAQPATSNPQTAVYDLLNRNNTLNIIGRNIGEEMGQEAQPVQNYIEQASAESGYMPPLAATTSTAGSLEDLANTGITTATTPTVVADTITGNNNQTSQYTGLFSKTGDKQVDLIGRAMELAMDADDAESFAALLAMYNTAVSKIQDQSSDSNLSAAQQTQLAKFDSADDAINELEALYNQAGGGKGPIAGNLQSVAGDWGWDSGARTYNQMAEGLVNQIAQAIGKTDSLNTEGEVQRALKLVPSLTDDAQTAQNKLRTLREMLAQTKANYYGAYGV